MKRVIQWLKQNIQLVALTLASILLLGLFGAIIWRNVPIRLGSFRPNAYRIRIAAGPRSSAGFMMVDALRKIANRDFPMIDVVEPLPTKGSGESLGFLQNGTVDMAVAQGDFFVPVQSRRVAVLYENQVQLVARKSNDRIQNFWDLGKGKSDSDPTKPAIGLVAPADLKKLVETHCLDCDDQYHVFEFLAHNFGFTPESFRYVGTTNDDARAAFQADPDVPGAQAADVLFRVAPPGNQTLTTLADSTPVRIIPIPDAAAMHLRKPGYYPGKIITGTYKSAGSVSVPIKKGTAAAEKPAAEKPGTAKTTKPAAADSGTAQSNAMQAAADAGSGACAHSVAVPCTDVDTLAVKVNLLASSHLEPEPIRILTQLLMERRPELAGEIPAENQGEISPLFGSVSEPENRTGFEPPVHPGAAAYYHPVFVPFVVEYANLITAIVAAFIVGYFWYLYLGPKVRAAKMKQLEAALRKYDEDYHDQLLDMMAQARKSTTDREIEPLRDELFEMFENATRALTQGLVTREWFHSFQVVWNVAHEAIRTRRRAIRVWEDSIKRKTVV